MKLICFKIPIRDVKRALQNIFTAQVYSFYYSTFYIIFHFVFTILNLNCNVCENRKNCKIDVENLSLLEYLLLIKIGTNIKDFKTVENMSKYHKTQFVTEFSNYYWRCVDPLRSHKNVVKTSLHEIPLEEFRLFCITYKILPGQKLFSL